MSNIRLERKYIVTTEGGVKSKRKFLDIKILSVLICEQIKGNDGAGMIPID